MTFLPENKTIEFELGKLPYDDHGKPESLLDIAMNFGVHLEHACGGSCACTTCHVIVREGYEDLDPPTEKEDEKVGKVRPCASTRSAVALSMRPCVLWPSARK